MNIEQIAALITEDPDISLDAGQDTAGSISQSQLQKDNRQDKLEKTQQDLEAKEDERRKSVLKPQIDQLKSGVEKTRLGATQTGQEIAQDITNQNMDLDRELRSMQQLLAQIDKAI